MAQNPYGMCLCLQAYVHDPSKQVKKENKGMYSVDMYVVSWHTI